MHGRIEVVAGCMFAGKTTELLRRVRRYGLAKKECVLVKHINDDRYSETSVVSHDRLSMRAISCARLGDVRNVLESTEVIAIDEGQFYTDLHEVCTSLADMGKIVIVAALDATFERKPFHNVSELCADAECITKLKAVCQEPDCGNDATFTWRTASRDAPIEYVGGAEMYIPVCRDCYNTLQTSLK